MNLMEMPYVGSLVTIESIKHDGSFHRSWEKNRILHAEADIVVGYNHHTVVHEAAKAPWRTNIPAIFYFHRQCWFNIIYLLTDGPSYYCNISSPVTYTDGKLQYIDYDLDVFVHSDGMYDILDQHEYEQNCRRLRYPSKVQQKIYKHLEQLIHWIDAKCGPFHEDTMQYYVQLYKDYDR